MLNDILILDQLQWHPHQSNFPPISWPWYSTWPSLIISGFHRAFATGVACQQGTLTLPDIWFCPFFGDCLCSNCWDQFSRTRLVFSRFSPGISLCTFWILLHLGYFNPEILYFVPIGLGIIPYRFLRLFKTTVQNSMPMHQQIETLNIFCQLLVIFVQNLIICPQISHLGFIQPNIIGNIFHQGNNYK